MKPKCKSRRRLTVWILSASLVLAAFFYFTRDFWVTSVRAYAIGRISIAAEEYGRFLPEVDEVEILAVGGEVPEGSVDSFRPGLGPARGTVNRCTLRGSEAQSLASLWRSIYFDQHFGALCHDPYYALRFRNRGKLVLETSICWKCSNVTLPVGFLGRVEYGFDAKSANGQKLLAMLIQYAPHPPSSK